MLQHDPLDATAYAAVHAWHTDSSSSPALWRRQNVWDIPLDKPLTLQSIWTMLGHLVVTRYLIVASFALGFYDYFLTLPEERTYVWKSRPSAVRSIYFFVRYSYFPIGVMTLYGQSSVASPVDLASLGHIYWQHCPTNVPKQPSLPCSSSYEECTLIHPVTPYGRTDH